jgi:hypothetical protein
MTAEIIDRYNGDEIRRSVPIESVVSRHVTLKHDGREYTGLCPFHNERTPSFKVVPVAADKQNGGGFYHCFGCGAHGDVIDFTKRVHGVEFREACEILCGESSAQPARNIVSPATPCQDPYADLIAVTPPARSPRAGEWLELWNPKGLLKSPPRPLWKCKPVAVYQYRDASKALLGCVLRITAQDGSKITPTIRYAKCPDGVTRWASWHFEKPRPLYRAEYFTRESGPIIVCEGEKAADAAAELMGALATTWPNGSKAVHCADWSLVKGRELFLWGDADQEGEFAMLGNPAMNGAPAKPGVAQLASAAGAKIKGVFSWDRSKPKGWDAADALRDGWSRADAVAWMNKQVRTWK